jgi:hypothetical protein
MAFARFRARISSFVQPNGSNVFDSRLASQEALCEHDDGDTVLLVCSFGNSTCVCVEVVVPTIQLPG